MTLPNQPTMTNFISELQQTDTLSRMHLQTAHDIFVQYKADYDVTNKIPTALNKSKFVNDIIAYYGAPEWFIHKIRNQKGKVLWLQMYLKLQWFYKGKLDGKAGPLFLQAVKDKLTVKHQLHLLNQEFTLEYNKYATIINQMDVLLRKDKISAQDELKLVALRTQVSHIASVFEKHLSKSLLWPYQKKLQNLLSKYHNMVAWVPPYQKGTAIFASKTTKEKLFWLYSDEVVQEGSQGVYDALKALPTVVKSYQSNADLLNYLQSIHNQINTKTFASKSQSESYIKLCKWVENYNWLHSLVYQRLNKQLEQNPERPWLLTEVVRYVSIVTDRYHADIVWRVRDELEEPEMARQLLKKAMLKTGMFESILVSNPLDILYDRQKIKQLDVAKYYAWLPLRSDIKDNLLQIATIDKSKLDSDQKLTLLILQNAILPIGKLKNPSQQQIESLMWNSAKTVIAGLSSIWEQQNTKFASKVWDNQRLANKSWDFGRTWAKGQIFDMYQDIAGSGKLDFADETNTQLKEYAKTGWAIAAGIAAWFFTGGATWAALGTAFVVWGASNVVIDQTFNAHGYDSVGEGVMDVASNFVVWGVADMTGWLLNGQIVKAWAKIVSRQITKVIMDETLEFLKKNPNLTIKGLHMLSGAGNAGLNIALEWARRERIFDEDFDIINCISNGGFGIALWVMFGAVAGKTPRKLLEAEHIKLKQYADSHPDILTKDVTLWGQTMKWSAWLQQLDIQIQATKNPTLGSKNPEIIKQSIEPKQKSIIASNKSEKPIAIEQDPYKAYIDKTATPDQQVNIMKQWMRDHDVPEDQISSIKPTTWKAVLDLHNDPNYPWVRKHSVEQLLGKIAKLDVYEDLKNITYIKKRTTKDGIIKTKKESLSKWLVKEGFVATPAQILNKYNDPTDPKYIPIPKIVVPTIDRVSTPYANDVLIDINTRIADIRWKMVNVLSLQKSKLDRARSPAEQVYWNAIEWLEDKLKTNFWKSFTDIDIKLILDEAVLVIDGDELKFAKPLLGAIGKLTEVENIITTQKKRIIDERTPRTWWWVSDVKKIQLNKEEAELDKLSSFISTLKAEFWGYQSKQNAQFTWYEYRNFKDFEVPFLNAKEIFDSKPRWKIIIYNDTLNQNITSINLGVGATNYKISDPSVQYIKLSEIHKFVNKEFKDVYFSQWEEYALLGTKEYARIFRKKLEAITWEIEAYSWIKKDWSWPDSTKVKEKDLNKVQWATVNDVKSAVKSFEFFDSSFRKRDDINDFIDKFEAWDVSSKDLPKILITDKQFWINMLAMSKTQLHNLITWPQNRGNLLRSYHMARIMRHLYNEWWKYDVSFKDGKIYTDWFKDVVMSSLDNIDEIISWEMKKFNRWSFLVNGERFAQDWDDALVHYRKLSKDLIDSWDSGYVVEYGKKMQREVRSTLILWGKVPKDIEILSTKAKADADAAWKNKSTGQVFEEFVLWTYKEKTWLTKALSSIPYIWSNKIAEQLYKVIDICWAHERIFTVVYAAYNLRAWWVSQMWVGWLASNVLPGTPFVKWLLVGFHTGAIQSIAPWLRSVLSPSEKEDLSKVWWKIIDEQQQIKDQQEAQKQRVRWLLKEDKQKEFDALMSNSTAVSIYSVLTQLILNSTDPEFIKEQIKYIQQCLVTRDIVIESLQSSWSIDQYDQQNYLDLFDSLLVQDAWVRQTALIDKITQSKWKPAEIISILKSYLLNSEEGADVDDSEERVKKYSDDESEEKTTKPKADKSDGSDTPPWEKWPYDEFNVWDEIDDYDTGKVMVIALDKDWKKVLKPKE